MMFDATPIHNTALDNPGSSLGRDEPNRERREMSFQKHRANIADAKEVMSYRQFFAKRWQAFIQENFASPSHVAAVFGVTAVTASNWWDGYNAPQGWVVGKAMTDPELSKEAVKHLTGGNPCDRYAND